MMGCDLVVMVICPQGFLPAHLVSSAVKSHSKQCSLLTEKLTQLMEQLDGMVRVAMTTVLFVVLYP